MCPRMDHHTRTVCNRRNVVTFAVSPSPAKRPRPASFRYKCSFLLFPVTLAVLGSPNCTVISPLVQRRHDNGIVRQQHSPALQIPHLHRPSADERALRPARLRISPSSSASVRIPAPQRDLTAVEPARRRTISARTPRRRPAQPRTERPAQIYRSIDGVHAWRRMCDFCSQRAADQLRVFPQGAREDRILRLDRPTGIAAAPCSSSAQIHRQRAFSPRRW
jgi:hypothetical protein